MIFFFEIHWHDLGFLDKILIFLEFLGKINCQYLGKKSKKSKILATNETNPRSWREIQDYPRLSKIIQDLGKKTKTPNTGKTPGTIYLFSTLWTFDAMGVYPFDAIGLYPFDAMGLHRSSYSFDWGGGGNNPLGGNNGKDPSRNFGMQQKFNLNLQLM